jgi:ATP-binding cassette subfamily F protein 3
MDYVLIIEDKKIRKMNMKKFRKMIHSNYFDKDFLEIEQKKKLAEKKIEFALKDDNVELAKRLSVELEKLIKLL